MFKMAKAQNSNGEFVGIFRDIGLLQDRFKASRVVSIIDLICAIGRLGSHLGRIPLGYPAASRRATINRRPVERVRAPRGSLAGGQKAPGSKVHFMIMGDFNFPDIDFEHGIVGTSTNTAAAKFFNETQDMFFVQHVHAATPYREGQQPSTLDYVFTDEENLIEDVKIGSPLGKSDHAVMEWDVTLKVSETESKLTKRNFWKGDYNEITQGLSARSISSTDRQSSHNIAISYYL